MSQVIVTTGARLHFGLLSHVPGSTRRFGGVGLMLDQPGFQVVVSNSDGANDANSDAVDTYLGPPEWESRVLSVIQRCRASERRESAAGETIRLRWELRSVVPGHVGLGSGTQLGLSVAQAWMALHGEAPVNATQLAQLAGRGLRSALGIHGFHQGGLLVEAGKRESDHISPLVARAEFPGDWRMLLICPPDERGLSGSAEIAAFSALPPMSDTTSAMLCRHVLLELLPSVLEADFAGCSQALFDFGWKIGEYFAPAQGGVFASRRMEHLVEWLRRQGIAGVGQSSWGPLLAILCQDEAAANGLAVDLQKSEWGDCQIQITAAKNTGANLEVTP